MSKLRVVQSVCIVTLVAAGMVAAVPAAVCAAPAKPKPGPASPAVSGEAERIVATVNDAAITRSDVTARVKLALLTSGLRDTPEARTHLGSQVLRQLIDEKLQVQEAKRLGASASDDDVRKAMADLAKSNRMTSQQMEKTLADHGVPLSTMTDQIRAAVEWRRLIQRRVQQEISISDEEVRAELDKMKQSVGKPERLVAEIFLAVSRPDQDQDVKRAAERLVEDVRHSGNFANVARQFSQGAGASAGGDLGWVREGDLAEELNAALRQLRPGQMSPPVRSADGYHIFLVRAQRTVGSSAPPQEAAPRPAPRPAAPRQPPKFDMAKAKANLKQFLFPAVENSDAARKEAVARAEGVRKTIKNCADFEQKAKSMGGPGSGDMGMMNVRDMMPGLQQFALLAPLGQPSPVMSGPAGAIMFVVCKRDATMIAPPPPPPEPTPPPPPPPVEVKKEDLKMPNREDVENKLFSERAEQVSRRYLRDLQRAAFIEIRR